MPRLSWKPIMDASHTSVPLDFSLNQGIHPTMTLKTESKSLPSAKEIIKDH
uniref:Uncharacterized protein n=1 Tax=Anguilla anguilla TaxID=7936 RepID=A0A0E9T773_ANGAN